MIGARHDHELRNVGAAVRAAKAEGASFAAVAERVVNAYRGLDLGGPRERELVAKIDALWKGQG